MYKAIILSVILVTFSFNIQAENRFSMPLEYELMDECVGNSKYRSKQIKICSCALEKTQENGFGADYDNDEDYFEDKPAFNKNFSKNIKRCIK